MTIQPILTHILLIEDNPSDAERFRSSLAKATIGRFEVEIVDRMSAALERAAAGNIDVVVLDLSPSPGFGLESLETMRQAAPSAPIVVLAGDGDERLGVEALSKGAQDYIHKGEIAEHWLGRALLHAIERSLLLEQLSRRDALLAEAQRIANLGSFEWDILADNFTCSEELYRIYGVEKLRFDPTYRGFVGAVCAEDRERVHQVLQGALSNKQAFDVDYRILRMGGLIQIHARGRVVVDGAGLAKKMAGTCQDTTERRMLEGKLLLAARMSSIGTLASGIAHEINNPLSYVMSNLEFLSQDLRLPAEAGSTRSVAPRGTREVSEAIEQARQGAERVRRIVSELKTFSRADEENRVPIALQPVLELAINLTFNEIRHRARLVKDYGRTPYVEADEARLSQVFVNLLVNAAQAIGDGKVNENEIRIVTTTDSAGRAVVEIRDTGCGISETNRAKIFDPFFTTKPVGVGTGLGLSIIQGIVATHGGQITLENSAVGKGTTFRVVLPAARPDIHPVLMSNPPAARIPAGRRGSILIVDDEPMVATALRRILALDHEVTTASNGSDALARFDRGERFDVVLCDLMMPVMNGMELYELLSRAAPEQADKIIFVTGGAFTPSAKSFLDRVPNPRIEKPFESMNLRALIRSLVRG